MRKNVNLGQHSFYLLNYKNLGALFVYNMVGIFICAKNYSCFKFLLYLNLNTIL